MMHANGLLRFSVVCIAHKQTFFEHAASLIHVSKSTKIRPGSVHAAPLPDMLKMLSRGILLGQTMHFTSHVLRLNVTGMADRKGS